MLIALSGLPGAGKTTIARGLARQLGAAHVRVDTIEQTLVNAHVVDGDVGVGGYCIAYAVAEDQLRSGLPVVADSVNPLRETREAWHDVATRCGTRWIDVEVVCSDASEHQRRLATRPIDIPGLHRLTWREVAAREYEPWDGEHIVVDTAATDPGVTLERLLRLLGGSGTPFG